MKQLAKPPPDLAINHLLPALGDKNDIYIFTRPFRMPQAPISPHPALPRSLKGPGSIQITAGTVKPLAVPRRSRGFTLLINYHTSKVGHTPIILTGGIINVAFTKLALLLMWIGLGIAAICFVWTC